MRPLGAAQYYRLTAPAPAPKLLAVVLVVTASDGYPRPLAHCVNGYSWFSCPHVPFNGAAAWAVAVGPTLRYPAGRHARVLVIVIPPFGE